MEHYSQRLQRNFADGDWLTRDEVAKVIEENSGKKLAQNRFVGDIARRQGWSTAGDKYAPLYQYEQVKNYSIGSRPGRRLQDDPSPAAVRQRAFKARHKQQELQKVR